MLEINRKKPPPFGKALQDKLQAANPPRLIIVCIGRNCWGRARNWRKNPTVWALLMPISESVFGFGSARQLGSTHLQIIELVKILLVSGAALVTVPPCRVDISQAAFAYDASRPISERWVQIREQIITYPGLENKA